MKVLIAVTRRVQYATIVEMTDKEYRRISEILEDGDARERRATEAILNDRIDVRDWQDDSLDSIDDFSPAEDQT